MPCLLLTWHCCFMIANPARPIPFLTIFAHKILFMKLSFILLTFFIVSSVAAQTVTSRIYDPSANAAKDIADAVKKAKLLKKHVLLLAGGNWCSWCLEFNRVTTTDPEIDSLLKSGYVVYHLNFSP